MYKSTRKYMNIELVINCARDGYSVYFQLSLEQMAVCNSRQLPFHLVVESRNSKVLAGGALPASTTKPCTSQMQLAPLFIWCINCAQ